MSEIAMSCGPIQRVVDLPSEYWQELVDCWMCHEEDFTELREGDLGARAEQALIGGTYILIHATDVDQDALIIEDDAQVIDLWMLNWDSTTITNQEPPRDSQIVWDTSLQPDLVSVNLDINHPSTKVSKMMKVLFLGALSREQEDIQKKEGAYSAELKLWDKWRGDPGVERLQFQKPLLLGFLTMLEQSSICQPPSVSSAASTFLAMDCMRIGSIPI
ncbi:hypothetical protein BCR41DRAFT_375195 [Lobosporangium transversale]|uniref:Uncharacterized protein n=1 Tax=Lobosporangium transversale TaxID=64571 RepID=A0A1Y2G829_9FUNG|nr:hypothetical protein BCR41DRAFT_375195 [Lobosporangium transversale]ORZ01966.1 hypothetical protein BCR41DRAFT_375195 [Lobosporangium transversale]|eukprot:XP_021876219.1 hypothetical protein BCR41DRAFT_375195 [Lobosporangium transversale]